MPNEVSTAIIDSLTLPKAETKPDWPYANSPSFVADLAEVLKCLNEPTIEIFEPPYL